MTAPTIVNTRAAFRLSVLDAVRAELDGLATPIEGGPLDGIKVVSVGSIGEGLERVKTSALPPIDEQSAEVKTPADVFVDAICPECNLPTRILIQLTSVLETTREAGSTIKLKAKAKGKTHVHHQLALEAQADGQESFELGDIIGPGDDLTPDEQAAGDTPISSEPEVVRDLLLLVLSDATIGALSDRPRDDSDFYEPLDRLVESWDEATRAEVVRWASAVHLVASDHDDVEIPAEPEVIARLTRPSADHDDVDLRPTGEVNADELRGAVEDDLLPD